MAQKDVHLYKLNSTVIIIRPQGEKDIGKKKNAYLSKRFAFTYHFISTIAMIGCME